MTSPRRERTEAYDFDGFRLDLGLRQLSYQQQPLHLSSKTFDILQILVENRGRVVTKEELFRSVWLDQFVEENNLTVRMSSLRKTLSENAVGRFIETVPGQGYRFVARVSEVVGKAAARGDVYDSLAVMPLITDNPELGYLCDGITDSLITSLSHLANLRVMARTTVFRYQSREFDPRTVGEELGVGAILLGKVTQLKGSLIFDLELIDVRDGAYLWGGKFSRQSADLVTLQEELVREISEALRLKLTNVEEHRLTKRYTNNPKAYQLYMKGRFFTHQRSLSGAKKSIAHFKRAIKEDPRYSLAFAGLADAYILLSGAEMRSPTVDMPRARTAALKALELDQQLAEAHVSLGNIRSSFDLDWAGAEREFKLAIKANPYYAPAYQYYANFLVKLGHVERAMVEINKAYEMDPISLPINLTMGKIFYFARRYDDAVKKGREILEIEPRYRAAHGLIGIALLEMSRYREAIRALKEMDQSLLKIEELRRKKKKGSTDPTLLADFDPEGWSLMGLAYGVAGKRTQALKMLDELVKYSKKNYALPYHRALIYLGLGDTDRAFEWLEKALADRCSPLTCIKVWPAFDSVRTDQRYKQLVLSMGLQP